jgi:diketogulonate reductase-like aldo/keto reductase
MPIGPGVGFGTMEHADGSHPPEEMYEASLSYLRQGGRHLDCAELYSTAQHVARAIKDSEIERSELHITTKLCGLPSEEYPAVRQRLARHLEELGIASVDLLLIHWPGAPIAADVDDERREFSVEDARKLLKNEEVLAAACCWEYFEQNVDAAWANMQRLREDGLCAEIGVSNFSLAHLDRLAANHPDVPPRANQIHISITQQQRELVSTMLGRGILPIGYRSLAFLPVVEMAAGMGDTTQSTLKELQATLQADSISQVVLAWLVRRGCHVLAKSTNDGRNLQNISAQELARSSLWPAELDSLLADANGSEMVAMCEGVDWCSGVFMGIAPDASDGEDPYSE